jgi:hypothetical protein
MITQIESRIGLPEPIAKLSSARAILVSIALRPIVAERYQLWAGEKLLLVVQSSM